MYLNFLNFLVNDSIFLLDESLNKILEIKQIEAEMSNTAEWEQRPAQERQDRTRLFHSQENVSGLHLLYLISDSVHNASKEFYFNLQIVRIDMKLANEDVTMLAFTSEEITAPFLLPEMVNLTLY